MSDLNLEEEKIPFDNEPIERRPSRDYRKEIVEQIPKRSSEKYKSFFYILCAGFLCIFSVMTYMLVNINKDLANMKAERNSYTMNISSVGGDTSFAATKGMLSTVSVSASSTNNGGVAENFFSAAMASRGSGVIFDINKETGDAYIITNYHVVCSLTTLKEYNYVWILLWDSITPIPAQYIGGSYTYDVAVLKVNSSNEVKNSSCIAATIGESAKVSFGENVVAIGNAMARNLRATTGVVAVEEELLGSLTYNMYIGHSADVNSGNSGGGLYNSNGELIGIVNAKFRDVNENTGELIYKEVIHGMNFAIPIDIAVSVAKNIIRNNGQLLKPNIGISLGNNVSYDAKYYNINESGYGYTTYELIVNKSVGKFRVGDTLVSMSYEFEGKNKTVELNRLFGLENNIYNLDKGDKVKFVVEGREFELIIDSSTRVS